MLELLTRMLTWATLTRDQDGDGHVQADVGDPRPIERVVQLGLPGAYAVAKAGVKGVFMRLLDGGWFFAADTPPPADAVVGEVGWTDGTAKARLLPTHKLEVAGTTATGGINLGALDGTDLGPAPPGPLPAVGVPGVLYPVARTGDLVQLGSTPIGNVIASTTRTKAT